MDQQADNFMGIHRMHSCSVLRYLNTDSCIVIENDVVYVAHCTVRNFFRHVRVDGDHVRRPYNTDQVASKAESFLVQAADVILLLRSYFLMLFSLGDPSLHQ